jgi:DNA-binding response OmpR family regulator
MSAWPAGPILIVDSDRQFGSAIAEQLMADGYAVELARSAEHARILAGESSPKLAVLGHLDTPRGALGLLEEIRGAAQGHSPWDGELPAIVLAAHAQDPPGTWS